MIETVNFTVKIKDIDVFKLKKLLSEFTDVVDLNIVPDTSQLYETDKHFQKLVKEIKKAKEKRDIYLNDNNKW